MKRYDIQKIELNEYKAIIFSTSYETPLQDIDEISKELCNYVQPSTKVVFDFLLNMGNNSERYAEVVFNGCKFVESSFKYLNIDKKSDIRKFSSDYFKSNSDLMTNSILTSIQKQLLIKGATI